MKILFLTPNLEEGYGIVEYNKNLLKALAAHTAQVRMVELNKSNLFFKIIFFIQSCFAALSFKPNIVFCTHINLSPVALFINYIVKKQFIIFTHGIDVWDVRKIFQKKALQSARVIVSVSGFTRNKLAEQFPDMKDKIFLLPNVVDGKKFYPKTKNKALVSKFNLRSKKVIFTLSRLSKFDQYKGYEVVLSALPSVIDKVPNAVYILAGSGNNITNIRKLIRNSNLEDKVFLPGFVPDNILVDYYNLSDIFVMPSKGEGFGIVFLEALACGKPVVAGNKDGSTAPLLHGRLGLLVNPDDVDSVSDAIIRMLTGDCPPQLIDSDFLRTEVLRAYSFERFNSDFSKLINIF